MLKIGHGKVPVDATGDKTLIMTAESTAFCLDTPNLF